MNDQSPRSVRLRYTATGALATLAAVGAIYGTAALAAKPHAQPRAHAAAASGATKTPVSPVPGKPGIPPPPVDQQPFLNAVQRLVDNGTISAAEAQVLDGEIQTGRVDTGTLAAAGFTVTQLQAVQETLGNAKRALAPSAGGQGRAKAG